MRSWPSGAGGAAASDLGRRSRHPQGRPCPHPLPGQWDYARRPSRKELAATALLALSLEEASVKVRSSPPDDGDSPDAELPVWAGTLPLHASWGTPEPDPLLTPGIVAPPHIAHRSGTR